MSEYPKHIGNAVVPDFETEIAIAEGWADPPVVAVQSANNLALPVYASHKGRKKPEVKVG